MSKYDEMRKELKYSIIDLDADHYNLSKFMQIIDEIFIKYRGDIEQPKINGWIPCSERLPEMWKDVMICYYNDKEEKYLSDIAYLDDDGCWNLCREAGGYFPPNFKKKITHWKHLPDLPEECHG